MNSMRLFAYHLIMGAIPPTRLFRFKRRLLGWAGAEVGENARIVSSAKFHLSGRLVIGANTWIGHDVMIVGGDAEVRIGCDVDIAPRVSLVTGSHHPFTVPGKAAGEGYSKSIVVGDGAWIGAGATILGGVRVGRETIVAAGALVRRDVLDGTVVAGVPARLVASQAGRE